MSNPESPTVRGSSNSARMPASLTSRHNPRQGKPPGANSTWKPVVMRGSRYTNLRILSKSLIPVGPARLGHDPYANSIYSWYVSAQNPHLLKQSISNQRPAPPRP